MKIWILAIILLASTQSFADKVDDLDAQVESENMEVFDQKAIDQQAQKETQSLERQSRALEAKSRQLEAESKNLNTRIGSAQEQYAKVSKHEREIEQQNHRIQTQRDRLKTQVQALRAKADQAKNRLQSAQELSRNLSKEIRDQGREKDQLLAREKAAEQKIQRANHDIKRLRDQQRKVGQENVRLQQKVSTRENRANSYSSND